MRTKDHAVWIAGAGPTGLMLAGELGLAGVDVGVLERRPSQALAGARAGGLHSRTLEVLDQRGIVDRFLAAGQIAQVAGFAGTRLDISHFPTRHPYGLGLWQNHVERLLTGWVTELGVPVYRNCEITGVSPLAGHVAIALGDGSTRHGQYLVGCDGGRSLVRKLAGIAFPGADATTSCLLAEGEMTGTPPLGVRHDARGIHAISRVEYVMRDGAPVFKDHGPVRVMITETAVGSGEPTLQEVRAGLVAVYGTDFGLHDPTWLSRFNDMSRQAEHYRAGRVLLAGDAAHVHAPDGGHGLNTGVQDAVNLGWKLALVVKGLAPASLLDTYHAERHPVGARVLRYTMAAVALRRSDARSQALRETVAELLAMDEPRQRFAAAMTGLDIRYDMDGADGQAPHPLLGRRMPDLDLMTDAGPLRLYPLLHSGHGLLLNLGERGGFDTSGYPQRVQRVDAQYTGEWRLPGIGPVPAPVAVLVRPDGHVAWVGDRREHGLSDALQTWFGAPVITPRA